MTPTDLLIDGYNLLHAAGLGQSRYGRGDLQRARQALLRRLFQLLTPAEIARTAVVFDARRPPPHLPPYWCINGLRVVYARPHGDADLILEELIEGHSAPKQLTVVSSDHRLHRAAKTRRATAIDSDEFLEFLERRHPQSPATPLPPEQISKSPKPDTTAAELAYWMSVFGDVKVSELVDPPRPSRASSGSASAVEVTGPQSNLSKSKPPSKRSRTTPSPEVTSTKPAPELFSAEWIAELQRWADQQR